MEFQIKKATKSESKLRLALIGASGSGKTYTSLQIARGLVSLGKVCVIDTERGSASKYADKFDGFSVIELESFEPSAYVQALEAAAKAGFELAIIDSLSHAWSGKGGALDQVDKAAKRSQSGNTFTAWRDVTPQHNQMIDAIVGASLHVIATMRAKTEYVMEDNGRGKMMPRKIGLAPVQRDGLEYEFDVVATMDDSNTMIVSKTRCEALAGGVFEKPNGNVSDILKGWLAGVKPVQATEAQRTTVSALLTHFDANIKGKTGAEWAATKPSWVACVASANEQARLRGLSGIKTDGYSNPGEAIASLSKLVNALMSHDERN